MFLSIENSCEMWMEEAENIINDDKSSPTKVSQWTERRGSGRKFGGWGNEGMQRYNQLHKSIKEHRNRQSLGTELEEELRKNIIANSTKKGKRSYDEMQLGDAPSYDMPDFMDS